MHIVMHEAITRRDIKAHRPDVKYHILPQVEEVSFQAPVSIGDLLRFQSHVAHTARRPDDPTLVCNGGDITYTCTQMRLTHHGMDGKHAVYPNDAAGPSPRGGCGISHEARGGVQQGESPA